MCVWTCSQGESSLRDSCGRRLASYDVCLPPHPTPHRPPSADSAGSDWAELTGGNGMSDLCNLAVGERISNIERAGPGRAPPPLALTDGGSVKAIGAGRGGWGGNVLSFSAGCCSTRTHTQWGEFNTTCAKQTAAAAQACTWTRVRWRRWKGEMSWAEV